MKMAAIALALMLMGCGDPRVMWEAHNLTWPEKVGETEIIEVDGKRFQVNFDTFDRVMNSPCSKIANTEAAGCTLWISSPEDLTPAAERLMQGYDARIWVVPNEHLLAHELEHARCQCQFHL